MHAQPKTQRGRESRDRIVAGAAALIAERGVEHMSVDDVLASAGASKSQLYHYFADREELIDAAVERRCNDVLEQLGGAFAQIESLAELERRLEGFVVVFEETFDGCPLGTIAADVAGRHAGAQQQVVTAFSAWEGVFADLFARLRERGELRPDADPGMLATALLTSLEGGQLLSQMRRDASSVRIAIAASLGYIRTFAAA